MSSVLILMPLLFAGGSEKQVRLIAQGLAKKGLSVTLLIENGTSEEHQSFIAENKNIDFVFLKGKINNEEDKTFFKKFLALVRIWSWLLRHCNRKTFSWVMFTNLTGLFCVPFVKIKGSKILFNERNAGAKMCNSKIKRALLHLCTKIVANSQNASTILSETLHRNVECINNGVSVDRLPDNAKSLGYILVPARVTTIKNQMVVLKSLLHFTPAQRPKVVFAGVQNDSVYQDQLDSFIDLHGLHDCVEFVGYASNIAQYYREAGIVILPSYEEGTPNVLLESYAMKAFCLASDIVMNRDVCVNDNILFSPDDDESLSRLITWAFELSNEEKQVVLDKNHDFVMKNYSVEVMQDRYCTLFSA